MMEALGAMEGEVGGAEGSGVGDRSSIRIKVSSSQDERRAI